MCKELKNKISDESIKLQELVEKKGSFTDPEVLAKSQEIDELIIALIYKQKNCVKKPIFQKE